MARRTTRSRGAARALTSSVVLAGSALLGCSDEPNIEKADLINQGDQICQDTQRTLQAELDRRMTVDDAVEGEGREDEGDGESPADEGDPTVTEAPATEAQIIQQVIIPEVRRMFARIEELGTPDGDGDELRDIYDRIDVLLDSATPGESADFSADYAEILADLRAYGFEACAESAGP